MENERFDAIAKHLGLRLTRRRTVNGALAALLGSATLAGTDDVASKKKREAKGGRDQKRRGKKDRHSRTQRAGAEAARGNAGGGNSNCAHFCQEAFPPGPDRD